MSLGLEARKGLEMFGHFLTEGNGTGGMGKRMPCLKLLSLQCKTKAHCIIVAPFACHRGKGKRYPAFGSPHVKVPEMCTKEPFRVSFQTSQ